MDPSLTKVCSNCKEVKNLGEFYSCKTSIDKKTGGLYKVLERSGKEKSPGSRFSCEGASSQSPLYVGKRRKRKESYSRTKEM